MQTWKEFVLFVADFQNLKRFSPPSRTPFRRCRRKSTPTAKALPRPRSGPCSRDLNRYWPRGLSLGIPTKSIIVSEVISITRSEVMPIKIGAKRRWRLSSWRSDRHPSRKFRCFFFLAVVLSFEGRLGLGRSVAQRRPLGRRVLGVA